MTASISDEVRRGVVDHMDVSVTAPMSNEGRSGRDTTDESTELEEGRILGRRRRWTDELDYLLLQEVSACGAHVSPHGKGKERYSKVAEELNKQESLKFKTDWKHVRDRTKRLLRQFKRDDARRARSSGEEEEVSDMDILLNDMILEVEAHENEAANRRDAVAARMDRLEAEGAEIRNAALRRTSSTPGEEQDRAEDSIEEEYTQGEGVSPPRTRRRVSSNKPGGSDEITFGRVEQLENKRREVDLRRLELEEKRFQKECEDKEKEREERKENWEAEKAERKALVDLLAALANKIGSKER